MKRVSAVLAASVLVPMLGFAQANGTNAVSQLSDNVENATATFWPLMIGITGLLLVVGIGKRFIKRA